jgi:phospholipase D1/2
MHELGSNADAWSMAGLRLIPIAPFTVVNLLAGAARVRLRDFLLGTLIGMGPGIVLICLSVDRARAALSGEPVFDPWIIGAIAAAGIAVVLFRYWQQKRR